MRVTALMDAAETAERIASGADWREDITDQDAAALRLLASHARESSAQIDAWKRLAIARGYMATVGGAACRPGGGAEFISRDASNAAAELKAMGVNPWTGKLIAAEEPR